MPQNSNLYTRFMNDKLKTYATTTMLFSSLLIGGG